MLAYLIGRDFSIVRVEGTLQELRHNKQDWGYVDYDDSNEIWHDDFGLFSGDVVLAWIGRARRVPLPVLIMGVDGERSVDPTIELERVRFGPDGRFTGLPTFVHETRPGMHNEVHGSPGEPDRPVSK